MTDTKHALGMLRTFGLSESEAKVYVYLVERGSPAGGSKIAVGAKMHRQYVYIAIPRLIELGLIEEVPHGKQNKYKAKSPSAVEKIARRKVVEAEDVVRELRKFSKVGNEQDFEIIVGAGNIRRYELERARSIRHDSIQYIMGGTSSAYIETLGEAYEADYAPLLKRKRVTTRYIGMSAQGSLANYLLEQRQYYEIRTIPKMKNGVVNFMVCNDSVYFYTFVEPPTLYVIKSAAVAESYLDLFNVLWDVAEVVK